MKCFLLASSLVRSLCHRRRRRFTYTPAVRCTIKCHLNQVIFVIIYVLKWWWRRRRRRRKIRLKIKSIRGMCECFGTANIQHSNLNLMATIFSTLCSYAVLCDYIHCIFYISILGYKFFLRHFIFGTFFNENSSHSHDFAVTVSAVCGVIFGAPFVFYFFHFNFFFSAFLACRCCRCCSSLNVPLHAFHEWWWTWSLLHSFYLRCGFLQFFFVV